MRIFALISFRILSVVSGLIALVAAARLVLGAYAVFTVQDEFPDATPRQLGEVYGALIDAPLILSLLLGAVAYLLWRIGGRYRANSKSNHQFQRTPDGAAE